MNDTMEPQEPSQPEQPIIIDQKESIKLIKGQRGGFGWEIKILSLDIESLEKLNNQMQLKFGEKGGI
jgi:hypothetical protein